MLLVTKTEITFTYILVFLLVFAQPMMLFQGKGSNQYKILRSIIVLKYCRTVFLSVCPLPYYLIRSAYWKHH